MTEVIAADDPEWGARIAEELRSAAPVNGADRSDFSWMTDNPDKVPLLPRRPLAWADLKGREPQPRAWAVRDWLPMGAPALLAGRGGIGKTLLAQTIGTCLAANLSYFTDTPRPLRVLCWFSEDDHDELWRRQLDICAWAGIGIEDLEGRLFVQPYAARDVTLAGLVFGQLTQTPLMAELREQVQDYRAEYVFLDSLARIFGGSENDRHQVTTFVSWITAACDGAGLCILGHPGKAAGSEFSGSTAWEGSVRARLYLGERLPDAEPDADTEPDDAVRYLARRKANYSAKDWVKLEYCRGVLMPSRPADDRPTGQPSDEYRRDAVLRAVRTLAAKNIHGSASTASPSYLPKLAAQYKQLDGMSKAQFTAAMRQLILEGKLVTGEVGRYQNRTPKTGLRLA